MKKLKLYGKNGGGYALVDDDIYEKVSWYPWKVDGAGYPRAHKIRLHEIVMGEKPDGKQLIDHISRDKLDNRRSNLRFATLAENAYNRDSPLSKTGHRGIVRRDNRPTPYWVAIHVDSKTKYIGSYKTLEEAIAARKNAEEEYDIPPLGRPRGAA